MPFNEINEFLSAIDGFIGGSYWFVYLLLGTGVFFTFYLRFPQLRFVGHATAIVRGKYDKKSSQGDTSHFQSLATALSGTVGTGNIAGVAFAIHLGGPPAVFWMMVTALVGMTTKMVEVTLSHKYREVAEDGSMAGGPMYYMKNRLNLKWLAALFAGATIVSSFGTGNLPQINSIANSMYATFGVSHILTGGVLAVLLGVVILGGIKRIAATTEKLVPAMAILYFIGVLLVIFYNAENILPALKAIFGDVFSGSAATGGFLGASIAFAFNRGVNRGLFSNEAGQGSAPIAHAAAKAQHPVSEGMVALLEPFIDTIIICFLTALALLTSGVWNEKLPNAFHDADMVVLEGVYSDHNPEHVQQLADFLNQRKHNISLYSGSLSIENGQIDPTHTLMHARSLAENVVVTKNGQPFTGEINVSRGSFVGKEPDISIVGESLIHSAPLTATAFTRSFAGKYGEYIVTLGLLLFAFSTAISWSYYGERSVTYLFGIKWINTYRLVYVIGFFMASVIDTTIVWTFSGIAIALMTIPNLVGILLLRKEMKTTLHEYLTKVKPNLTPKNKQK